MTKFELYRLVEERILREEADRRAARRVREQDDLRVEARSRIERFIASVSRVLRAVYRHGIYWPGDAGGRGAFAVRYPSAERVEARDEWHGVMGHAPYPQPDHDREWRGTMLNPFAADDDVGRRD